MSEVQLPRDYLLSLPAIDGSAEARNFRVSSKLVVTAGRGSIYLGRLAGRGEWTLPGGGMHESTDQTSKDEGLIPALQREMTEEGYRMKSLGKDLGSLVVARFVIGREKDYIDEHGRNVHGVLKVCHLVEYTPGMISHAPSYEVEEARFFSASELPEVLHPDEAMLANIDINRITDHAKSHPADGIMPVFTVNGISELAA